MAILINDDKSSKNHMQDLISCLQPLLKYGAFEGQYIGEDEAGGLPAK